MNAQRIVSPTYLRQHLFEILRAIFERKERVVIKDREGRKVVMVDSDTFAEQTRELEPSVTGFEVPCRILSNPNYLQSSELGKSLYERSAKPIKRR